MSSSSKSSGSEGPAIVDEKKRKRMESNRDSARRSRQRKQQHLDDLVRQASQLQNQNGDLTTKVTEISRRFGAVEAANAVLKAEKERLARRLESLESVIEIARVMEASNNVNCEGTGRSVVESSNGSDSIEFGGCSFPDGGSGELGLVNPWRQTMTPDPAVPFSMAVMAASSDGMFRY